MLIGYYIRDNYLFSDNLYMRNNIFLVGNKKKLNNHFIAKNKKIKDIIQSCPLAAPRGLLAPYIFTLGRLGNISLFGEKSMLGTQSFHDFRVLGYLEHILVIVGKSSREKKMLQ